MPYYNDGRPLWEEEFAPVFADGKYEKIVNNRFGFIIGGAVSQTWGNYEKGMSFCVTMEGDGSTYSPFGIAQMLTDNQADLTGSLVNVPTRMAGTAHVECGAVVAHGDYVKAMPNGTAMPCEHDDPNKLGRVTEDGAIGSYVFVSFNGHNG